MTTITYEQRGVSADKTEVKAAVAQLDRGLFPGAFCHAFPDILTGSPEHCLLSHADGAGTKSVAAYLHYKRHGDASIFEGIAQDSLAMNIDDLLCVGALGPFILSNTIGRNAKLIPGEVITAIVKGYRDVSAMLGRHGIDVHIAGGETADVGDLVRTVIVDSTLTTRLRRDHFIDAANILPGQTIVGLASDGQATYETTPNSGVGSNGITSLRHELLGPVYRDTVPEAYAPEIHAMAYCGPYNMDDPLPGLPMTVGQAILSPTRTYAPLIKAILDQDRSGISAIFHNTGGGHTKCLNFGRDIRYVKDNLFPEAPFFRFVRETRGLPYREMLRTLNMGFRMEIVCDPARAADIIAAAKSFAIEARILGHTEASNGLNELSITTPDGIEEFAHVL